MDRKEIERLAGDAFDKAERVRAVLWRKRRRGGVCAIIPQNWDFVTMADYRSDMKEITDRSAAVVSDLRARVERAERALAEVVLASGGRVALHAHVLIDPRCIELTMHRNDADNTIEFVARRSAQ